MRRVNRLVTVALATLGVLVGGVGAAAPAFASTTGHGLTGSFGSGPCEVTPHEPCEGKFKEPYGVAVNEVTSGDVGDVYVVDKGNRRVERFSAAGVYLGEFNGSGTLPGEGKAVGSGGRPGEIETGEFVSPRWISVDNSGKSSSEDPSVGDVYVADDAFPTAGASGDYIIDKFSPAGAYLGQITTEGNGSPLADILGMAVDPRGTVWVDSESLGFGSAIDSYSDASANVFVASAPGPASSFDAGFAVDSEDNFYALFPARCVGKFKSTGAEISETNACGTFTISVDPSDNDVYLGDGEHVSKLSASGSPVESFGERRSGEEHTGAQGIGIDSASDTVYVTDDGVDEVGVYTVGPRPPAPHSEAAKPIAATTATLRGALKGEETRYYFAYNTNGDCTGAGATPIQPATGAIEVSTDVTGLQPDKQYTYCIVAKNAFGSEPGSLETFETNAAPPEVIGEAASQIKAGEATLGATLNANNQETNYRFEYSTKGKTGTGEALEGSITTVDGQPAIPPNEFGERKVGVSTGAVLAPTTTYYYRVVAENEQSRTENKPVVGKVTSFQTVGAPLVSTGEAQGITGSAATFSGTVNPGGAEASYYFAYIAQASYEKALAGDAQEKANLYAEGEATAPLELGEFVEEITYSGGPLEKIFVPVEGFEPQAVGPILAAGLRPGETYHYALIAKNEGGITIGPDETFRTLPPTPPTVSTGPASGVSQNSATLSGTVDTNSLQTEYGFEIGTEPGDYGPAIGLGSLGGALTQVVSVTLGELQPATTYYFRVTASSADGTVQGEPSSFTTPAFPTLVAIPASPPLVGAPDIAFPAGSLANTGTGAEVKTLTNKQKLAKALKACKREKQSKRAKCEATAKKRYGAGKRGKRA